ncbi:GMC oxidoreductase-domain-containing protein [Cyathus striatus]|nr:GMC oxidoreductase-domain-containing protein [Cyathus striatus]
MLSGIGPRDVLESVGVAVVEELAGVGQHLQDHLTGSITWQANFETLGDIEASQSDFSHTPEFLSSINNAIAFLNLSTLFSHSRNDMLAMKTSVSNSLNASVAFVPSQYSEVKEGYKMIYKLNAEKFLPEEPQLEFLLNVINPGVVKVQAALQHPFSTGRVYINSSNPFDQAVVDPQYFSHPADITVLRQGIKLTRTLGAAFQSLNLFGAETSPGTSVETDEDWESWLRKKGARTEYHPSSSCVMLPRTLGGVVDKRMKVHGVANVRVVDSSVYPFEFAAHLGSATYGLAELGAQLIKEKPILVSASIDTSDAMTL